MGVSAPPSRYRTDWQWFWQSWQALEADYGAPPQRAFGAGSTIPAPSVRRQIPPAPVSSTTTRCSSSAGWARGGNSINFRSIPRVRPQASARIWFGATHPTAYVLSAPRPINSCLRSRLPAQGAARTGARGARRLAAAVQARGRRAGDGGDHGDAVDIGAAPLDAEDVSTPLAEMKDALGLGDAAIADALAHSCATAAIVTSAYCPKTKLAR